MTNPKLGIVSTSLFASFFKLSKTLFSMLPLHAAYSMRQVLFPTQAREHVRTAEQPLETIGRCGFVLSLKAKNVVVPS